MTNLQIRNIPEVTHRKLKARAALEGMSLSEYALTELVRSLSRPSRRELSERIAAREPVDIELTSAELVEQARR